MNNSFFGNDDFPNMIPNNNNFTPMYNTPNSNSSQNYPSNNNTSNMTSGGFDPNFSINSNYAQNFLRKNIGIRGYFFVSYPDSVEWRDKIFYGILSEAGDDYILVYNEENREYYLIWSIYLNYATFDRKPN